MIRRIPWLPTLVLACVAGACGGSDGTTSRTGGSRSDLSAQQRDAETLGREIFDLVDRAMDYRGSHEGRPANTLRQMGVESLTPVVVRRVVNVQREPVVTVAFRKPTGREIVSCLGDKRIIEDAFVNGGRFTIMCTMNSGAQRPMEVGGSAEP
jgi:hypothetical protein